MRDAKIARVVAGARTGALIQVAWTEGPLRARHAIDGEGRPMLLCRTDGVLDNALREGDVAVVINVCAADGKVWMSGWATALDGPEALTSALDFAAVNPVSDLLDLGRGFRLYRVELAEVRLERGRQLVDVDVDDFVSAVSEPVT